MTKGPGGDALEGVNAKVSEDEIDSRFVFLGVRFDPLISRLLLGVLVSL